MAPIRDLFASPYRDTRLGALVAVRKLLETRGELLRGEGAWRHVVVVLRLTVDGGFDDGGDDSHTSGSSVTETPVQIGFRALQLVASDFLPVVAFSVVGTFVEALGLYGGQKNDVNSALTSVSLLWGVADFVAKVSIRADNTNEYTRERRNQREGRTLSETNGDGICVGRYGARQGFSLAHSL